jgi:error-prone DNA polymerase
MLPRMKPACFYDLVMQVAIIRPGPIQGDMIHPFLRRRNGLEPVTYPHPKLKPILERTLGVPLFQEQGMRMAIEAAGFSPGEADTAAARDGAQALARAHGRDLSQTRRAAWSRTASIARRPSSSSTCSKASPTTAFPESHAASFALLAYASSYVKCHEPAIFCAAILNVQPMGFYSTEVLVNDARRHGVHVKPVEVNASEFWSFVDGRRDAARLSRRARARRTQREGLEAALARRAFADLLEFAARTGALERRARESRRAGAFSPWFATRRDAMWALRGLDEREARGELGRGMEVDEPAATFAPLERDRRDGASTSVDGRHDRPAADRALPRGTRSPPCDRGRPARAMPNHLVCKVGGMVVTRQRPGTAKGFVFLTLEDETGLVNVIVNPTVYERNRRTIRTSSALVIEGVLQKEQGTLDVLAKRFWPLDTNVGEHVLCFLRADDSRTPLALNRAGNIIKRQTSVERRHQPPRRDNGVIDRHVDSLPAGRRHRMSGVTEQQETWFRPALRNLADRGQQGQIGPAFHRPANRSFGLHWNVFGNMIGNFDERPGADLGIFAFVDQPSDLHLVAASE